MVDLDRRGLWPDLVQEGAAAIVAPVAGDCQDLRAGHLARVRHESFDPQIATSLFVTLFQVERHN